MREHRLPHYFACEQGRLQPLLIPPLGSARRVGAFRFRAMNSRSISSRRGNVQVAEGPSCLPEIATSRKHISEGGKLCAFRIEVRLPQRFRLTDGRESASGHVGLSDICLARRGTRAAKSCGCRQLCPSSLLLYPLRLASAAPFVDANLRSLLDGNNGPCGAVLRPLRRCARTCRPAALRAGPLPSLPARAARV